MRSLIGIEKEARGCFPRRAGLHFRQKKPKDLDNLETWLHAQLFKNLRQVAPAKAIR